MLEKSEIGNTDLKTACRPSLGRPPCGLLDQQELVVGCLLNLNEVRHLRDFLDFSEKLANALPTDKRLRHHVLSLNRTIGLEHTHQPSRQPSANLEARGFEAIKATLQKTAIHRDRRDRRRTTVFSADSAKSPNIFTQPRLPPVRRHKSPISTICRGSGPTQSRPYSTPETTDLQLLNPPEHGPAPATGNSREIPGMHAASPTDFPKIALLT